MIINAYAYKAAPAPIVVPVIEPAAAWNGTADSGHSSPPADPARSTAKPVLRMLVPPNQTIVDDLLVAVVAAANDGGTLMIKQGVGAVDVYFDNDAPVTVNDPSFQTFPDANGNPVRYLGWWFRLKRPSGKIGRANLRVEATARDGTMQKRVLGPYPFIMAATQYDAELTVAASQTETGTAFASIPAAIDYARTEGFNNPLITITEAGLYDPDKFLPSEGQTPPIYTPDGYTNIRATVPGVQIGRVTNTPTNAFLRPYADRLHFMGSNITLNFNNVRSLYTEDVVDGNHWFDGCNLINSDGRNSLLFKRHRDVVGYLVRGAAWFTEVTTDGLYRPVQSANLARGCYFANSWSDVASGCKALIDCTFDDIDTSFYIARPPAMTAEYTGSGSGTLEMSGVNIGSSRTLTAKVDGVAVGTFTVLSSGTAFLADTNYTMENVRDWLNSLTDWTATVLDGTRQAVTLQAENTNHAWGPIDVNSETTLYSWMDIHSDLAQYIGGENIIVSGNIGYDIFDCQCIFLKDGDFRDVAIINNAFSTTFAVAPKSHLFNTQSHVVYAHNTLPAQIQTLRWERTDSTKYVPDAYCLLANNSWWRLEVFGTPGPIPETFGNHIDAGETAPIFGGATTIGGDRFSKFVDAANGDFRPAGELLSNLKPSVLKYGLLGNLRSALDVPGAVSRNAGSGAAPVDETPDAFTFTDVSDATLSTQYISNTITVAGLGAGVSVPVTVAGASYSKNGGAYTTSAGTAINGDTFAVRHTSSSSNNAAVNTTLTIGGVSDTFTSTTADVVNTAPTITSPATFTVAENAQLVHELQADEAVTWTIVGGSDQSQFENSGSTLRWTGNGTKDFEAPDDSNTNNIYIVTVRATDSGGLFDEQTITGTLSNINEAAALQALTLSNNAATTGQASTITIGSRRAGSVIAVQSGALPAGMTLNSSTGTITGTANTDQTANFTLRETLSDSPNSPRDTALSITVSSSITLSALSGTFALVEDAATGDLAGAISGRTSGSTLTLLDNAGGRVALAGTNINAGPTALDHESDTSHSFTVREALAGATNSPRDTVFTLTVTNVFEQPNLNALTLDPDSIVQGQSVTVNILGSTSGSAITASQLPAGMTLNSSARTITGTPSTTGTTNIALDEDLDDSANSVRTSNVTLAVTAPADTTAPNITSADPSGSYNEGVAISDTLTADETVTWSVNGADASAITMNANTGVWSLEATDFETKDNYAFTFRATDAAGNFTEQPVTISITNVLEGASQQALALDDDNVPENDPATINILNAVTGATITLQAGSLPAGMTLDGAARTISGTPTTQQAASFTLREVVTDGPDSPRDTTLSITVSAAATPATISIGTNSFDDTVQPDGAFRVNVAVDQDNGLLYSYLSMTVTQPDEDDLIAGTGASKNKSEAVTSARVYFTYQAANGLPDGDYYSHHMHVNANGDRSAIVTSPKLVKAVGAPQLQAETTAFLAAVEAERGDSQTGFNATQTAAIDAFFVQWNTTTWGPKVKSMRYAFNSESALKVDMVSNAVATFHNGMTYADGFDPGGIQNAYANLQLDPFALVTQDSVALTLMQLTTSSDFQLDVSSTNNNIRARMRNAADISDVRAFLNSTNNSDFPGTQVVAGNRYHFDRSGTTEVKLYENGVLLGTDSASSTGGLPADLFAGNFSGNTPNRVTNLIALTTSMTASEMAAYDAAIADLIAPF